MFIQLVERKHRRISTVYDGWLWSAIGRATHSGSRHLDRRSGIEYSINLDVSVPRFISGRKRSSTFCKGDWLHRSTCSRKRITWRYSSFHGWIDGGRRTLVPKYVKVFRDETWRGQCTCNSVINAHSQARQLTISPMNLTIALFDLIFRCLFLTIPQFTTFVVTNLESA